ncbi:MAG: tetratricopeptide repeat protein [Muribaculaceae bacterium]|nr:tetratricopeptide repeat protein [Muribaculaceae bacterium]
MKKRIIYIMCMLLTSVSMMAQDEVKSLVSQFDKAGNRERVTIANTLFSKYIKEVADTVFRYDNSVDQNYLEGTVYYWAAEYSNNRAQYGQAALYVNHALPLYKKYGDHGEYSDCLALAGAVYTRMGDFATAVKFQEECLALDRKSGDKQLVSSSLNNIAATCISAGMIDHAEKYILEAIRIERELNRPATLTVRLGMASEIFTRKGNYDTALQMADEALKTETAKGNPDKVPVRQSQLAAVLTGMGKTQQAMQLLRESEKGLRATGNNNSLAIVLNQMGEIEVSQGNDASAVNHLRESVKLCQETGNLTIELKARHTLCKALRATDPQAAMAELEQYATLKDSVYSTEAAQSMSLFNVKYETAEKEHSIELLEEQVKNNHLMLGILGIVLLTAAVVALLMWRLAAARGAKNRTLIKANLLKDELLEIAKKQSAHGDEQQKITQVAHEMGNMGEMPQVKITKRENEVMLLCCDGLQAKEIADKLNISQRTVETHKTNLFKKLGINNTVELVRYAQAIGAMQDKKG